MTTPTVIWKPHPGSQTHFLTCPIWECLLGGNRGGGKGFAPSEKVLTPSGWKTMNDLKAGSVICNPDGTDQKVVQVFHRELQDMYRLTFSDGTVLDCDGDHLWLTKIVDKIKGETIYKYHSLDFYGSVYCTEDLFNLLKQSPTKTLLIPCSEPIKYTPGHNCSLDAYLIGLLIGCTSDEGIQITSTNPKIIEYITARGFESASKNTTDFRISTSSEIHKIINKLKLQGCHSWEKFIPERLLQGSIQERWDCLQGLMDTNAVDVGPRCMYSTTSKQLAKDIRQLVLSLGGWASENHPERMLDKTQGRLTYSVHIRVPDQTKLFRLACKKEHIFEKNHTYDRLAHDRLAHDRLARNIQSIEKLDKQEKTICIIVDNLNHLFITKDFVVTHNSDSLLMSFLQHCGRGHGADWRGIIFRQSYTQLTDFISTTKKWIPKIFPDAKYNGSTYTWKFSDGEELLLRYARVPDDYLAFHGWQIPFLGWEELSNFATPELYLKLMSINRSSNPDIPKMIRSTTNPSGPGNRWLRDRFVNVAPPGTVYTDPETNLKRVFINSSLFENKTLLEADPEYLTKLKMLAQDDPNLYKAWILGEWDLNTGGFFSDIWDDKVHELPNFAIPSSWKVIRSFDWGSAKPWAVSYVAISNGEQPELEHPETGKQLTLPYFPTGSAVVFDEIYGWDGTPDVGDRATSQEIAERVLEKDKMIQQKFGVKISPGPADTSIYDIRDGGSIGQNLANFGCRWTRAYKGAGSRITGWALIRTMLGAAVRHDLEKDHLYFCEKAFHHIRCFTEIQHDARKPEDLDTSGEDHCLDSLRYLLNRKMTAMKRRPVKF